MSDNPKRRWYQFSLKMLMVGMTLVSIALAWLAYERNEVRKREAAIAAIESLGGEVDFDLAQPFRPIWLRPMLGDKSPGEVVSVHLVESKVTDDDIAHVAGFKRLERLDLRGCTQVTDAGLVHLAGCTKLEWLFLTNTQVTDHGLAHLACLTNLDNLYLNGTPVTDAGLVRLAGLKNLRYLCLTRTKIKLTDQGVSELEKALPNLAIAK